MITLRCLSVRHPWAELIATGEKKVENRTWVTRVRGYLGIHASKSTAKIDELDEDELAEWLPRWPNHDYHLGCVIAVVELVDCVRPDDLPPDLRDHEFASDHPDDWCFVLRNPVRLLRPVPATGNAMFFKVNIPDDCLPPDLRARLLAANTQG